jgi:hypothetical protein
MGLLCSKKLDTWLGIAQKTAIILGIIMSAWHFLLREEASPHVGLEIDSQMMSGCIFRATVSIENLGGRTWNLDSAVTRLYQPNLARIPDPDDLSGLVVGTQILKLNGRLRIGEKTTIGFNIKPTPKPKPKHSFFVVRTAITISEEDQKWIRIQEDTVIAEACE